jgi:GTPase SAR1 family protein
MLLTYSVCSVKSFEKCKPLLKEARNVNEPDVLILVGNKSDLEREVASEEAMHFAES